MTYIFGKWLKFLRKLNYVGNDLDLGKWLKYVDLNDKRLKKMENDLEIWEIAKVFGKWLRSMGHGLSI